MSTSTAELPPPSSTRTVAGDLYCLRCGYNLTGVPENRCPECGKPFDPDFLREHEQARWRRQSIWRRLWQQIRLPL